ncbi:ATP-binding protein [Panacibacter ginsenosidivorans]|uniref:ATP-binding protein n=1 Tax=Panacibacter ginsenosidivorans TaxID=1813871 RepID=A0A5B8VCD1_9BACT|nr:ATP-binding protein [Panacibacter ginsenosidivorans]QEC69187.1 ATP-binding protein [Panacibacter ginsenosidivorans]
MIIMVFGLPGSGKSYFASRVAEMIHGDYLNSDKLRKQMFGIRTYSIKEKLSVYNEMLAQMQKAIKQNKNVVLDATFYTNDIRKKFIDEVKNKDLVFIEVTAEEPLIRERLKRPRGDSEADFEVYKKINQEWEPLHENHLILTSTDDNIKDMLEKTADYLHLGDDKGTN